MLSLWIISLSLFPRHHSSLSLNVFSSERHFLTTLSPSLLFSTRHSSFPSEHLTQGIIIYLYVWPLPLPDSKLHSGAVINTSVLQVLDQYLVHHRYSVNIYWMNEWSICFVVLFFLVLLRINSLCLYVTFNNLSRHGFSAQSQESEAAWEMISVCNWPVKDQILDWTSCVKFIHLISQQMFIDQILYYLHCKSARDTTWIR